MSGRGGLSLIDYDSSDSDREGGGRSPPAATREQQQGTAGGNGPPVGKAAGDQREHAGAASGTLAQARASVPAAEAPAAAQQAPLYSHQSQHISIEASARQLPKTSGDALQRAGTSASSSVAAAAAPSSSAAAAASLLDRFLPPEVPWEAAPEVLARFHTYSRLSSQGHNFTRNLRNKKDFANPCILEKTIEFFNINEYGTSYPRKLFDPSSYGPEEHYEALIAAQMKAEEERQAQRKSGGAGTGTISFVSGGIQPGTIGQLPEGMRGGGAGGASQAASTVAASAHATASAATNPALAAAVAAARASAAALAARLGAAQGAAGAGGAAAAAGGVNTAAAAATGVPLGGPVQGVSVGAAENVSGTKRGRWGH